MLELLGVVLTFFAGFAFLVEPIRMVGLLLLPVEKAFGLKIVLCQTRDAYYFYNHPPIAKFDS